MQGSGSTLSVHQRLFFMSLFIFNGIVMAAEDVITTGWLLFAPKGQRLPSMTEEHGETTASE
jgi:hypothetical protein